MKRTPTQDKALGWYVNTNHLKPRLSTHPTYSFLTQSGQLVEKDINHLVALYESAKKEEKKA